MYRRFVLAGLGTFALAATLALGVNASRWETAAALTNCTTTTAGLDGEETTVIQLINQERANAGLQALLVAPSLARAAAWKSADPSNTGSGGIPFSHTDSLGRGPSQRAADCGYPGQAAENIAYGYSASGVVVAWMNSDGTPGEHPQPLLHGHRSRAHGFVLGCRFRHRGRAGLLFARRRPERYRDSDDGGDHGQSDGNLDLRPLHASTRPPTATPHPATEQAADKLPDPARDDADGRV
ncbi:MAG: CAP domain-containing protein [Dehalococcoidia bacterium]|nr:CAP domain-containing protein [Dehalococcoidia bacterium]